MDPQASPGQVTVTRIEDLGVDEATVRRIDHLRAGSQAALRTVETGSVGIGAADAQTRTGSRRCAAAATGISL